MMECSLNLGRPWKTPSPLPLGMWQYMNKHGGAHFCTCAKFCCTSTKWLVQTQGDPVMGLWAHLWGGDEWPTLNKIKLNKTHPHASTLTLQSFCCLFPRAGEASCGVPRSFEGFTATFERPSSFTSNFHRKQQAFRGSVEYVNVMLGSRWVGAGAEVGNGSAAICGPGPGHWIGQGHNCGEEIWIGH